MSRRLLLLTMAVAFGACATPETTPPNSTAGRAAPSDTPAAADAEFPFDATTWLDRVRATTSETESVALSGELSAVVDWESACGEDDPTAYRRGIVQAVDLGAQRALAEITCQAYAYQSTFVLVHAPDERRPRLVRSLRVLEDGTVSADTSTHFLGYLYHDKTTPAGEFGVMTKSAGHGGCGTDVTYRLQADGDVAVRNVRAWSDCEDPVTPDEWPATYSAE